MATVPGAYNTAESKVRKVWRQHLPSLLTIHKPNTPSYPGIHSLFTCNTRTTQTNTDRNGPCEWCYWFLSFVYSAIDFKPKITKSWILAYRRLCLLWERMPSLASEASFPWSSNPRRLYFQSNLLSLELSKSSPLEKLKTVEIACTKCHSNQCLQSHHQHLRKPRVRQLLKWQAARGFNQMEQFQNLRKLKNTYSGWHFLLIIFK